MSDNLKRTPVLIHQLCRIYQWPDRIELHICLTEEGRWIKAHPFPADQRGLVAALDLAKDVVGGRLWLTAAVEGERLTKPLLDKPVEVTYT